MHGTHFFLKKRTTCVRNAKVINLISIHLRKTASETNCKFEPLLLNKPAVLSINDKLSVCIAPRFQEDYLGQQPSVSNIQILKVHLSI